MSSRKRAIRRSPLSRAANPNAAKILPEAPRPGALAIATERQLAVLAFIKAYTDEHGMAPTMADIARHFGIGPNGVQGHVDALRTKGYLKPPPYPGAARSLVLA